MPWQQSAADVALEYDPVTGLYRYSEIDITVPRQSGKTTLTLSKKVHRLTVAARRLGPQRSTYVAQTRLASRKKLERDFANALRGSRSFREVPHARARPTKATEWRLSLNNGSESIEFGSGSYLQIDAPSRTGGHGDTLDDGDIDEAFSQVDDTVEASMMPAMATRKNAQLWVTSTAGDVKSAYLWRKILAGRVATETGEHGRVCYLEFSAPEDADPGDPLTWWGCMPALGITIPEDFIRGEWERAQRKGPEGVNTFRRAYLNQWPEIPVLEEDRQTSGIIPDAAWESCRDSGSQPVSRPVLALDVSPTHGDASIALAAYRTDGHLHVELTHHGRGTAWIVEKVKAGCAELKTTVGIVKGSAAASLVGALTEAGVKVSEITAQDYAGACGELLDRINSSERSLRHRGQPDLDAAVGGACSRTSGQRWIFDRRTPGVDITPICAVATAAHLAVSRPDYDPLASVY